MKGRSKFPRLSIKNSQDCQFFLRYPKEQCGFSFINLGMRKSWFLAGDKEKLKKCLRHTKNDIVQKNSRERDSVRVTLKGNSTKYCPYCISKGYF